MLYGYEKVVWQGALVTLQLALLAVMVSVLLGLLMVFAFWMATRKATAGVPGKWQAFVEICLDVSGDYHQRKCER